ncbi:TNF receptor-associated factor 3-like isoform X1 [Haemaphysalis longicornis]
MAAAGVKFTVFGFDSRIDWKPTVFVDGIPQNRVCSACGLVSAATALLPCHHLLCSRCYDAGGDGERNRCPLDKVVCQSEDVVWSTFTEEKLLGRKIRCWNSDSGCDVVGAVVEVVDHFEKCCQYHAVTCHRCKQSMVYKELLGHLEADDCSVSEANAARKSPAIQDTTITPPVDAVGLIRDQLSSLQICVRETKDLLASQLPVFRERAAADALVVETVQTLDNTLKESTNQSQVAAGRTAQELALMRNGITTMINTFNEVVAVLNEMKTSLSTSLTDHAREVCSGCQNVLKKLDILSAFSTKELGKSGKNLEALQKHLDSHVSAEVELMESLKRVSGRLSDEVCQNISLLGEVARVVSDLPLCVSKPIIWTVEKWSELKAEAATKGVAEALCEKPKYFYGYSIHPGVVVKKADGHLKLRLLYYLCQGGYDPLLTWPLQKRLQLHVLNAAGGEIAQYITTNTSINANEAKERPTSARSTGFVSMQFITVTDIERLECVNNDKVSVKFTVSQL